MHSEHVAPCMASVWQTTVNTSMSFCSRNVCLSTFTTLPYFSRISDTKWRFPKIVVPPNHPFFTGFSCINNPAMGVPPWPWNPPQVTTWTSRAPSPQVMACQAFKPRRIRRNTTNWRWSGDGHPGGKLGLRFLQNTDDQWWWKFSWWWEKNSDNGDDYSDDNSDDNSDHSDHNDSDSSDNSDNSVHSDNCDTTDNSDNMW